MCEHMSRGGGNARRGGLNGMGVGVVSAQFVNLLWGGGLVLVVGVLAVVGAEVPAAVICVDGRGVVVGDAGLDEEIAVRWVVLDCREGRGGRG